MNACASARPLCSVYYYSLMRLLSISLLSFSILLASATSALAAVTVSPAGTGTYRAVTPGTTLTASQDSGTPSWQWFRCGSGGGGCLEIEGETGPTIDTTSFVGYNLFAFDITNDENSTYRYVASSSTSLNGGTINTPRAADYVYFTANPSGQPEASFLDNVVATLYTAPSASGPWSAFPGDAQCIYYDCEFYLGDEYANKFVKFSSTASDVFGVSRSADSNVAQVQPRPCSVYLKSGDSSYPVLSGSKAEEGSTLSVSQGTWESSGNCSGAITYSYRWDRCNAVNGNCTPISGATSSSYVLTAEDVGSQIRACVTGYIGLVGETDCTATTAVAVSPRPAPPTPPVDTTSPTVTTNVAKGALKLKKLVSKGLPVGLSSNENASVSLSLIVDAKTAKKLKLNKKGTFTAATWSGSLSAAAPTAANMTLNKKAKKAFKKLKKLKLTLQVVASDAASNSKTTQSSLSFGR